MSTSKVTVFPVPVTRRATPEEPDPARMAAEIERLTGENTVLRERLAAVQTIALEREETIEDLRHALRMLPSVWAEKLEERLGPASGETDRAPAPPADRPATPPAEAVSPPGPSTATPGPAPDSEAAGAQAEAFFAEIAALRVRLERKRLEAEQEILEQERRRLLADIEWTRNWQRSRGARLTAE